VYVLPRTTDVFVDVAPEKLPFDVFVELPPENDLLDVLLELLFDKDTFGVDDELLVELKLDLDEEKEEWDECPPLNPLASAILGTINSRTNIKANKTLINLIDFPLSDFCSKQMIKDRQRIRFIHRHF
jgi:hypothetical protein